MQTCWWPTQWPLKRAATSPHLSGFVFYGCLESLTALSALWWKLSTGNEVIGKLNIPADDTNAFGIPEMHSLWSLWSRWIITWWRHQMETFSAVTGPLWGNSPVIGEFPSQKPVTRSFDVFFDLRLNKRLSKQSWDWWFETPSGSSWRHSNKKNCQKKSSHPMRGIRPSVGQWETALLEILKSYWAHCHAKVRFSLFPYGICIFFKSRLG